MKIKQARTVISHPAFCGATRPHLGEFDSWSEAMGVGLIVAVFATPMLWLLYGSYYTFAMFVFGLVAIAAGHLGRHRGKRLGGRDRGLALLGIVTGWLLIFCSLLLVSVYAGAVIGLGFLVDSAS